MPWQPRHAIADPLPRLSPALADAIRELRTCAHRLEVIAGYPDTEYRRAILLSIAAAVRAQADVIASR